MTFLLFLASLGLLNYILRRAGEAAAASGTSPQAEAQSQVATTAGLASLGRALDQQGRGAAPEPGKPACPTHALTSLLAPVPAPRGETPPPEHK